MNFSQGVQAPSQKLHGCEHQLEFYLQMYTPLHEIIKETQTAHKYFNSAWGPKLR